MTDSDFISNSSAVVPGSLRAGAPVIIAVGAGAVAASVVIKEYKNRNYNHQEIISNLFLLNIFILKENWYNSINKILKYQNTYLTKEYYPEINFHEKYYDDLVKYTNKMMVLL